MAHITPPPPNELPSLPRLRRAAALAGGIAVALVVVVVLPAERAVDITGLGGKLGLTEMGMIKMQFKAELAADSALHAAKRAADSTAAAEKAAILASVAAGARPERTDSTTIVVPPGEERAVRLQMREKAWVIYAWSVSAGTIEYDVRGDSAGAPDWWYHRYETGHADAIYDGVLVAKFTGVHGWLFRNAGATAATVTLVTRGSYARIEQ